LRIPNDLFKEIVGYEDLKLLFQTALEQHPSDYPVHFLLVGDVATAKTLFLLCLSRLRGSAYVLGSRVSRAGLVELLVSRKVKVLLFDEIDKVGDKECLTVLLSLMETGRIVETLHGKMRSVKLDVMVFATANDDFDLPEELLSRFVKLRFKAYRWGQFYKIAKNILVKREKIKPKIAKYIAGAVWSKLGSKDFRDCVKLARLVRKNQDIRHVRQVVKVMSKYS